MSAGSVGERARVPHLVAVGAGCALLLGRPALHHLSAPSLWLAAVYTLVLAAGVTLPPRAGRLWPSRPALALPALALGVSAFALGRIVTGGHAPPWFGQAVALDVFAAIAEESFFRRLVYDALLPSGAPVAVGGSALLFAAVHVSVYGWWVLPVDIGAGLVLSWQRWTTGSWGVPAITHAAANLLMRV